MMKRIGQLCKQPIYHALFITIAAVPLLTLVWHAFQKERRIQELTSELKSLENKAAKSLSKRIRSKTFQKKYQNANPYFLSQVVEKIPLLSEESALVDRITTHSIFHANLEAKHRKTFLNKNHISFCEKEMRIGKSMRETEEEQNYKVEVTIDDIEEFLVQVEGVKIATKKPSDKRPQLLIKEFSLENIGSSYLLNATLIKREFTNPKAGQL